MTQFVEIEKRLGPDGRVAVVRFDRKDGINALSPEALRQLTTAARSFDDDGETSVVVLTGSARAFSAGFDLKDSEGRSRQKMDIGGLRRHLRLGPRLTEAWHHMSKSRSARSRGFASAAAWHWLSRWIFASWRATPIYGYPKLGSA